MNNSEKKLKIILVNYRYFISGGPERYMFNMKSLLEEKGHTVIPFSVKHYQNELSEYEEYFLSPIGDGKSTYFDEYKITNFGTLIKVFSRMFYSMEAKRKLKSLINVTNPDLIYVLHYQNKISASIFDSAKEMNIPIVHRISDFGQICTNALFYRPKQKDICERCLNGSKLNAVVYKCSQNSFFYSTIKALSVKLQEIINISKKAKAFVVPSKFTISKLTQFGFPNEKLIHIPTFVNQKLIDENIKITYEDFVLYIGRIESEKGLLTLVKAFEQTSYKLKIIGFSTTNYQNVLEYYLKDKKHNIEFLGKKSFDEIQYYLSRCLFTVVPSECYDNFPNTILESFAFKKCVVATNIGSLIELVIDNETGLLFEQKDVQDLKQKIQYLFQNVSLCKEMGENGFKKITNEYSSDNHYNKLISVFYSIIKKNP